MLKFFGLTLGLWLALALLSWGFRAAGQLQAIPDSISQVHLSDCRPPCWIGIIPGETTVAEAKAKIVATFSRQRNLQIKDSGFADGPVSWGGVRWFAWALSMLPADDADHASKSCFTDCSIAFSPSWG